MKSNQNKKSYIEQVLFPYINSLDDKMKKEFLDTVAYINAEIAKLRGELATLKSQLENEMSDLDKTLRAHVQSKVNYLENYVNGRVHYLEDYIESKVKAHIQNHNNPHRVTCSQIGAATVSQYNEAMRKVNELNEILHSPSKVIIAGISGTTPKINSHSYHPRTWRLNSVPSQYRNKYFINTIKIPYEYQSWDNGGSGWHHNSGYIDAEVDLGFGNRRERIYYTPDANHTHGTGAYTMTYNHVLGSYFSITFHPVASDDDESCYAWIPGERVTLNIRGGGRGEDLVLTM